MYIFFPILYVVLNQRYDPVNKVLTLTIGLLYFGNCENGYKDLKAKLMIVRYAK